MKSLKVLLISFIAIMFFVGCSSSDEGGIVEETYKDGDRIELESIMGTKLTLLRKNGGFVLEGDEDKILLFDIFGTFCQPCQDEAPKLMNFQLKNDKDLVLIAFNYLESVTNEYVKENFTTKFNAYYFIVNSPENEKMVDTITKDIGYNKAVQVPFKVVLKDGKYQNLTDIYEGREDNKFYIGEVDIDIIQKDIDRIKNSK